jgi:MFS family permease
MFLDEIKKYPAPLQLSIIEGMFASIMSGGGVTFIVPFALFLGANNLEIGFLIAFPALFAAFAQLGSIKLLDFYKQRRKAIIAIVFFQALSWLLIALIPFLFASNQIFALIVIYTIGNIIGSIGGPLWQSWMSSLTPREILGEYFGLRNALTGTVVFLTMLLGGILLKFVEPSLTLYAFSAIFLLSFFGRFISSITFRKIEDPEFVIEKDSTNFITFVSQLRKDNFGYFVLFGSLMTFAIALVGPFLSVYLLQNLGLKNDYFTYTLIICASTITTLISMPYWGKIIDKYGSIKTIKATGFLASFYPILLILVRDPLGLIFIEALSGIIFSGFNLCLANFIYESFKQEKIIKYAGYQAALFGIATFFGVMLSGWIQTYTISFSILSNTFFVICAIAVLLRFTIFTALVNKIKEVRETKEIMNNTLIISVLTFEPVRESLFANAFLIISKTEDFTIKGVKTVGGLAKKGISTAEQYSKHASKFAEDGLTNVEPITKKEINNMKEIIKKRKGFL